MSRTSLPSSDNPGPSYDRVPDFPDIARDLDVMVPMRDGVQICVDIYRPKAPGAAPSFSGRTWSIAHLLLPLIPE